MDVFHDLCGAGVSVWGTGQRRTVQGDVASILVSLLTASIFIGEYTPLCTCSNSSSTVSLVRHNMLVQQLAQCVCGFSLTQCCACSPGIYNSSTIQPVASTERAVFFRERAAGARRGCRFQAKHVLTCWRNGVIVPGV